MIEVRKANGVTQEELSTKCNITVRTIQRIESGQVQPRAQTIRILSEALGFDFFISTKNLTGHSIFWHIKDLFNLKTHKMRKISILTLTTITLVASILLIQAQPVDKKKPHSGITITYNPDKSLKRVDVVFTNDLTLDSLIDIREKLLKANISVSYTFMEFDKDGHLTGIACNMSDNQQGKGSSGSFHTSVIKPQALSGFYYDYSKNAKVGFCCGFCWLN
ncbi:MAG: helix-turn-helix transcriptional regulator [Cyclobacteriaceae bacterium]